MEEGEILQEDATVDFGIRTKNRTATLGCSTMELLKSFMDDGDDYTTAKGKVKAFSQEITAAQPGAKVDYMLGDTTLLINTVQASILPHMSQAKKDIVINILNTQA